MASKKEIERNLKIAFKEIGQIKPWFSKEFNGWIFSHKLYPDVEYFGNSEEDVITNYPLYLREFIAERLDRNIAATVEKKTKGRGGWREGAGRPKGTKKMAKMRVYLPEEVAEEVVEFFEQPNAIPAFQQLVAKSHR